MTTLTGLGIGLSLVFGFLLLALVAELYYLLWWKKTVVSTESEEEDCRNHSEGFFCLLWRRRPSSVHSSCTDGHGGASGNPDGKGNEQDLELGSSNDLLLKPFGEEGIESELKRLHNLAGPPRFLFTIKEETKEDLESDSVRSRTRSLSDLVMAVDTPFLTPLASPIKSFSHHGLNPLFEDSLSETELTTLKSSPPPTFKFLRDAEEKLQRRLMEEEAEKRVSKDGGFVSSREDYECKDDSFVTISVNKNRESHELQQPQQQRCNIVPPLKCPPSSSQVLPLASSPTTLRPLES